MNAIDQAAGEQEKRRREALDAMARSGTAGVDAYKDATSQVQKVQQEALTQALDGAAGRGAGSAAQKSLETIIRQPGDLTRQHLAASQGTYEADMARRATANNDYFDKASAAVPVIKAASDREIGWARAQWEEQKRKESEAQARAAKADQDSQWEQLAITQGLADMQLEQQRAQRQQELAAQYEATNSKTYDTGSIEGDIGMQAYERDQIKLAQQQLAEEIASSQTPEDIAAQRQAYLQVYGSGDGDLRTQALARGLFRPPSTKESMESARSGASAQFFEQYGVVPTTEQLQSFQRGYNPFGGDEPRPLYNPAEVARQLGVDPEVLGMRKTITTVDSDGLEQQETVDVYAQAQEIFQTALTDGYDPQDASEVLRQALVRDLGHDYPVIRSIISAVYGG